MRHLLTLLLLAASAFGQTATISDTIRTPFGGTFSGTVTVSLNSPALAQPLYSGNVTLSGWTQAVTVTAGVFALTLYTNDLITPGGTSYTATYAPTSGSGWKETWIVPTGATTIREIRSTTVPSPSVRFNPSQITQAGATFGQGLRWNGSIWAPAAVLTDPMTTTGDLITRSGIDAVRVGIGSTGQVLTVSGGLPVWASGITGNASTATALAANPTDCSAGQFATAIAANGNLTCAAVALADVSGAVGGASTLTTVGSIPFVTAAGVLGQDAGQLSWSSVGDRLTIGNASAADGAGILTQSAGTVRWTATPGGGGAFVINNSANTGIFFQNNTITHAILNSTGNLLLGTGTDDGSNRLQVAGNMAATGVVRSTQAGRAQLSGSNSRGSLELTDSAGANGLNTYFNGSVWKYESANNMIVNIPTVQFQDERATIGSTSLVVRAGVGQSGNLTTWQSAAGGVIAYVNSQGGFASNEFYNTNDRFYQNSAFVDVGSALLYRFSSTVLQGGTKDLSLSRASANTLQVGDGSANSNGTILARIYTWANGTEGTCDATLRGQVVMVQGGAGVADTFRVCRKDAANAYAWTALY